MKSSGEKGKKGERSAPQRLKKSGIQKLAGTDAGWGLRGQFQAQDVDEQLDIGLGFGDALEDQMPRVGGGKPDVDHHDGAELFQHRARG